MSHMMQQVEEQQQGTLIQSVQRAAALLKVFDNGPTELGVSELSRKTHLHKSTASRLLATMEREGLLERVPGTEKYRLGVMLVQLAALDEDEVINIEQISGPHLVRDTNWVGRRTPLHCVANGKALLAFRPAAENTRVLARPLARFTERTIGDPAALRAELALI